MSTKPDPEYDDIYGPDEASAAPDVVPIQEHCIRLDAMLIHVFFFFCVVG